MKKRDKEMLRLFQCDYYRTLEEMFAQTFTENETVRLFFINENQAFTDGRNIVVDPAMDQLFADTEALLNTEEFLSLPLAFSSDPWNALCMITRAQNIHECLHILYTDFPTAAVKDERCNTRAKLKTMSLIVNIIEDAYIEAAGCSVFDNLELYLKFIRLLRLFASSPSAGTVSRNIGEDEGSESNNNIIPLVHYLDYMIKFLLYPMVKQNEPPQEIAWYVEQTKQLFLDGSVAPSPAERYQYCGKIFDLILPLIPENEELINTANLDKSLGGLMTHSPEAVTIGKSNKRGKRQKVEVRLFTDLSGEPRTGKDYQKQISKLLADFSKHKQAIIMIKGYEGRRNVFSGKDYECAIVHRNIKINETKPKINLNLKKAYQNIYNRYRININSYNSRFSQLLEARVPVKEDRYLFGAGISSKILADPKKRYWYRTVVGIDVPDLAVLLLVDGSGSMFGIRRNSAMISAVILHEVLKKQGISHAIVEHRARFEIPEIDINILVDFNAREEEKYNIMQIDAHGDNRDGLALFWAEKYINQQVHNEDKLIIVLSDGVPAHKADGYYPPVSIKDTANAVQKIIR
ncbi:MAG TPA: hypothetical protein GX697_00200, partial [Firmicutes bacterium]|nr:hypothetical protein [Bacillota bacterium]